MKFAQKDFIGGMNLLDDATKIADNEYPLLFNARIRNNKVRPVKNPLELADLPSGLKQGLYSAGQYLVAFVAGKAFYKNFEDDGNWTQVAGFLMSTTSERFYAELVDASTVNFKRQLSTSSKNSPVNLGVAISGSPKAMVVQDGINQAWVIFPDGTARVTQEFDEWSDANREYVPIGTLMLYVDGILYIIKGSEIFRSVSGRPLDFMVNIDQNGNKGGASEATGGATTVSHRVGFEEITSISTVQTNLETRGAFMVGTLNYSYMVVPRYDKLIFGEPTFANLWLFPTGPVNDFSITETISDIVFVNQNGLRSFNSIRQFTNEGKNSPFSLKVSKLFDGLTQSSAAATSFDNYALFACNTIYGSAIVVYDDEQERFVGLDIFSGVGSVKQFAEIKTSLSRRLFFITTDNKLYEAYASEVTATAKIFVGEWTADDSGIDLKATTIQTIFSDVEESGQVQAELFSGRLKINEIQQNLSATKLTNEQPRTIPFGEYSNDSDRKLTFRFQSGKESYRCGFFVSWNCMAELSFIGIEANTSSSEVSQKSQAAFISGYNSLQLSEIILAINSSFGGVGLTEAKSAIKDLLSEFNVEYLIFAGNLNYPAGTQANWQTNVQDIWRKFITNGKLYSTLGPIDLDTLNGEAYLNNFHFPNNGRYYDVQIGSAHFFFINAGLKSDNTLVEADGNNSASVQAAWIRNRLASSTAQFKIAIVGRPLYTNLDAYDPGVVDLRWIASAGFSIIYCGVEGYERFFINNTPIINIGLGGQTLLPYATLITVPYVKRAGDNFGLIKLKVNRFEFRSELYDLEARLLDVVSIRS